MRVGNEVLPGLRRNAAMADDFCEYSEVVGFFHGEERGRDLRKYVYIGIGGFAGSILRYLVQSPSVPAIFAVSFPVRTLAVNLAGCFLLAMFTALAVDALRISSNVRLGIATGFFGAFTTFSTVCKELAALARQGSVPAAAFYGSLSVLLGLTAVYLGTGLAGRMLRKPDRSADGRQARRGGPGRDR